MRIELGTATADDTRDGRRGPRGPAAAARHGRAHGRARRRARPRSCRGSDAASGVEDHVASPTFTLVREYSGRLDVAHVDVYRLERVQDVVDLGARRAGRPRPRAARRVGGRGRGAPPGGPAPRGAHDGGAGRRHPPDRDHAAGTDPGRAMGAAGAALEPFAATPGDPSRGGRVIVVGIETSTPQTSVAIGTEREILGAISVAGKARQEAVTPALEQLCGWTGVELGAGRRDRGRGRAGPVHGSARGRRDREDPRAGARACRSSGSRAWTRSRSRSATRTS